MCGIVGFIDFKNKTSLLELEAMTHTLTHRGPDAFGVEEIGLAIGSVRYPLLGKPQISREKPPRDSCLVFFT